MDIQKEREAFEKLPDINAILYNSEFGFNEDINQYYHPNHTEHRLSYAFLMGAWSAWQAAKAGAASRQAEINELQNRIDEAMNYVSESPLKDVSRRAMLNFLDILKGKQND